jgi:hypothetical protein
MEESINYSQMIQLLLDRADTYTKQTMHMLQFFDNVKTAIGKLMNRGVDDIQLQDLTPTSDSLVFTAIVSSEIGQTISMPDQQIIDITDENHEEYILNLLVEVPEKLIFENSDIIFEYLDTVASKKVLNTSDDKLPPSFTQSTENLNFDMSSLTVSQKYMYNEFIKFHISSGTKH